MYGGGDIVQLIGGVVEGVAAGREHDHKPGKREAGNSIESSPPSISDVVRGNPAEQKHAANRDPAVYAKKQRLEGTRRRPEVRRRRKSKMHDEPRATAHPQQRADDIDGATQTGGHTEAQRPQAAGAEWAPA